jgi:hypothetical protein
MAIRAQPDTVKLKFAGSIADAPRALVLMTVDNSPKCW